MACDLTEIYAVFGSYAQEIQVSTQKTLLSELCHRVERLWRINEAEDWLICRSCMSRGLMKCEFLQQARQNDEQFGLGKAFAQAVAFAYKKLNENKKDNFSPFIVFRLSFNLFGRML